MKLIRIHPADNVAVALEDLLQGEALAVDGRQLTAAQAVQRGHKIALAPIPAGTPIVKYGCAIGLAREDIAPGQWVHVHNVRTGLSENGEYAYRHKTYDLPQAAPRTFRGFRRPGGRAGIRNELWIIPTVGCVNNIAQQLVRENRHLVSGSVEGLYAFPHPFGCSQMGDDHAQTRKLLSALVRHPNAGGVLVLGLGCENLTMDQFKAEMGEWDGNRVKFLVCQDETDEIAAGAHLILFTTGRGTPFGAPAPTVKVATNSGLAQRKAGWIDFDAGPVANGEPLDAAGERLLDYVIQVASGQQTNTEKNGFREISIFKGGVVL